ncbi:hypothetical protein [Candidatus Midichloria mitochondrii]|nr:hypothetical protein [Candidatus Midichloria mitochondrii]MDJ1256599.1 hypothetical protein [Candidatus Midichloria mitochondrii]
MNLANLTEAILGIKNEEETSVIGSVNFTLTTNSSKNHNDILVNINLTLA